MTGADAAGVSDHTTRPHASLDSTDDAFSSCPSIVTLAAPASVSVAPLIRVLALLRTRLPDVAGLDALTDQVSSSVGSQTMPTTVRPAALEIVAVGALVRLLANTGALTALTVW